MFFPFAEKIAESVPTEIAVIFQVTVLEPPWDKLPTATVGVPTEKWPFCELRLAATLDNALYPALFTLTVFLTIAVTVAV